MTITRAIGAGCNTIIVAIVRGLALARIHPNVLTFIGLLINIWAAFWLAQGNFRNAGRKIHDGRKSMRRRTADKN